ncbi:hypothetical protein [Vibrio cholerae]|uniref:hypothetical protein n=1 Tax=Vibrio cholerae TaxID=666 RepID=UPI000892CF28|nr:hypothetical protein [Vibrio cholerae]OFI71363.1 hypothetical protein BFX16_02465 [Vibrio cholerae]OFI72064.1 hypothetical protein BFX15_02470 [Vibrio cholerae]
MQIKEAKIKFDAGCFKQACITDALMSQGALLRKRIIHFICYFSSGNKPIKALSLGRSLESAKNFILYFDSDSSWIHYYATKPSQGYNLTLIGKKQADNAVLSSQRASEEAKAFKSYDAAIKAAKDIGFQDVTVRLSRLR